MTASLHHNASALDEVTVIIRLVEGARRGYQNLSAAGIRVPGGKPGVVGESLSAALAELYVLRDAVQ